MRTMILIAAALILPLYTYAGEKRPGKLNYCPKSPNCVNSLADRDDSHYIDPFKLKSNPDSAWKTLKETILQLPRTKIIEDENGYMHTEFKSFLFRFVDDVEFQLSDSIIQVRSASRVGYSDLGVNRRRVEKIRGLLKAAGITE